jgi:hypothetical protein
VWSLRRLPRCSENTGAYLQVDGAAVDERVQQLQRAKRLKQRRERRRSGLKQFRKRLKHFWGDALDSLEELNASCAELGDLVARKHSSDTDLFRSLELLRARAVQIGWEVRELSSGGYADGAYARWRTLHELAVVTEFIRKFGEGVATRYLRHAQVKNRKVLREYSACCEELGLAPVPQIEIDRADEVFNQLLGRYGPNFRNEWGWAAEACNIPDPKFADLRTVAGYAHWKAHYGMANHGIHAGPHGVLFRLGNPLDSEFRLRRASVSLLISPSGSRCKWCRHHNLFEIATADRTCRAWNWASEQGLLVR